MSKNSNDFINDFHKQIQTSELVEAMSHVIGLIEQKGYENVSEESQKAYDLFVKFHHHASGAVNNSFATIYYP